METVIAEQLAELNAVVRDSGLLVPRIVSTGRVVMDCLHGGGKLLTCGNGGSATDAMHLAEELVGRYRSDRRPFPAITLNSDQSVLTCIANDYGFDAIFARQVQALGRAGDVLVGFSTSGNSANVLAAFETARASGVTTILLGGKDGGAIAKVADHAIIVPSSNTARIQEIHTFILHCWLEFFEDTGT